MIRIILAGLVMLVTSEVGWPHHWQAGVIFADDNSAWLNGLEVDYSGAPPGKTYVVASDGNDQNAGTLEAPFRTFRRAIQAAAAGDTIYVRGGVYHEDVDIRKSGAAGRPIRILAYEDEQPVLDGEYTLPAGPSDGCNNQAQPPICFVYKALVTIDGSYIDFKGFKVTRSRGRGIGVAGKQANRHHHVRIQNCQVHEVRNAGIHVLHSDHVLIEHCDVYHAGNFAPFSRNSSDLNWPVIVNTPNSSNVTIRKNAIHENWGEGVAAAIDSNTIMVEDNVIYDNYALQVYIHRTQQTTVRRNLIYHTNAEAFRRGGQPSECIVLNNEEERGGNRTVSHISISNNVIVGCLVNVAIWGSEGTGAPIEHVTITHNTLVNARSNNNRRAAHGILVRPSAMLQNVQFKKNIILQEGGVVGAAPDNPQLTFADNLWSRTPPATMQGSGDLVDNPRLLRPQEALSPGGVQVDWYKPQAESPALDQQMGPYEYLNEPVNLAVQALLPMIIASN